MVAGLIRFMNRSPVQPGVKVSLSCDTPFPFALPEISKSLAEVAARTRAYHANQLKFTA